MQTYFITANDTDVGKTYVTALLAAHFASQGKRVQVVKAVECGGSGDAQYALDFAQSDLVSGYTLFDFPEPLAPLASGNTREQAVNLYSVIEALEALPLCDIRLIEGAGGIAVPIDNTGLDWRDFARSIHPDQTLVVIDNRLGAINQSRLLHAYLEDLPHAFILNQLSDCSPDVLASNADGYAAAKLPLLATLQPNSTELTWHGTERLNAPSTAVTQNKSDHFSDLQQGLEKRRANSSFRSIRVPNFPANTLNLADNDYFNLRHAPDMIERGQKALQQFGTSASASPLITGYTQAHADLEATISQWYGQRPALVWNSGYAANQACLKRFVQTGDIVLADRLIHNSLINGALHTGARLLRFQHNNHEHLESLLQKHQGRRIVVVTESVYSMDGDYPDLQAIAYLKSKYNFTWMLDEAHALGWYGPTGAGLAEAHAVLDHVDILTGTLGKALASNGAYTVFNQDWMRDACINDASEFIYSTYFAPASAAIAEHAIHKLQSADKLREASQTAARDLRTKLRAAGWQVLGDDSPIVAILCGTNERCLQLADTCLAAGLKVAAIRPPTVPAGGARIRLSLKSSLTPSHYQAILDCFKEGPTHHG